MKRFVCVLIMLGGTLQAATMANRPQKLAVVRAHSILPETLGWLVKKNGKHLFYGLDRGMKVPVHKITDRAILLEVDKVTRMIDSRSSFPDVVTQMGFVSGLLAVYLDPSKHTQNRQARLGFGYYLERKIKKMLFVFDGYDSMNRMGPLKYLNQASSPIGDYASILDQKYSEVGQARYMFSERSSVFGVTSIYFSNLARLSAQLWVHAWSRARGDLTRTPYRDLQRTPVVSRYQGSSAR